MKNFEFHNPTKIIFGKDALNKIAIELREYGKSCLLVIGQKSARASGAYDRVVKVLKEGGINFWTLEGVQSNPLLEKVQEGIEIVRKNRIEMLLALGGGSSMDTAKAISCGVKLNGDVWEVFEGKKEIKEALPVFCIPTLAASGSEMNGFMVITNNKKGLKLAAGSPHLFPKVSFLNPELTFSVPENYTAFGGVDAICHLLEPYFNGPYPKTPVQDEIAEGLIRVIMETTESSMKNPKDYDSRANLMWAATLALNSLTRAGVGDHPFPVHLIEHSLSAIYNIPHGQGLAALLPGWMNWKAEEKEEPQKIAQLGTRCFGVEKGLDDKKAAKETIKSFGLWLNKISCPKCLSEISIPSADHEKIAKNALFQARVWGIEDIYNKKTILKILSFCQ